MKTPDTLILLFILFPFFSFGQDNPKTSFKKSEKFHSEISTRIGFNSLREINISYEILRKEKGNFIITGGYIYGSSIFTSILCNKRLIKEQFKKKGGYIGFGFIYDEDEKWKKSMTGLLSYSEAPEINLDPGCWSGSTEYGARTERYKLNAGGIGFIHHWTHNKERGAQYYFGTGLFLQVGKRSNYIVRDPYPAYSMEEDKYVIAPIISFDLGIKFNFFKFKRRKKD